METLSKVKDYVLSAFKFLGLQRWYNGREDDVMIDSSQRYVTTTSRPLLRDTVFYPNQLKYQKRTKHTLFHVIVG